jgi:pantetheine-phosphate adenylyltransferase
VRLEELKGFMRKQGWLSRAEVVPLFDAYGPALTEEHIDALVVSEETEQVARIINAKRRARNLKPLTIISVDMVLAENSTPISTTRIRRLEIDREGRVLK